MCCNIPTENANPGIQPCEGAALLRGATRSRCPDMGIGRIRYESLSALDSRGPVATGCHRVVMRYVRD